MPLPLQDLGGFGVQAVDLVFADAPKPALGSAAGVVLALDIAGIGFGHQQPLPLVHGNRVAAQAHERNANGELSGQQVEQRAVVDAGAQPGSVQRKGRQDGQAGISHPERRNPGLGAERPAAGPLQGGNPGRAASVLRQGRDGAAVISAVGRHVQRRRVAGRIGQTPQGGH